MSGGRRTFRLVCFGKRAGEFLMPRPFLPLLVAAMLITLGSPAFADTVDSLMGKSRTAEQAGHMEEAVRLAQAAIVADPSRASSYSSLGDLYLRNNQADFASFYYSEALEIDPQDHGAVAGLARVESAEKTGTAAAARSLDNPSPGQ